MAVVVAPSILSADFARLGEQIAASEQGGADRIHIDVMDGHFVPNLSMGPAVVKCIRRVTELPLEVHLMVQEPGRFADPFLDAGANSLIAHVEVLPDPRAFLRQVRGRGHRVGLAIRPDTPVTALEPCLPEIDLALCMTVQPGFSGQNYLADSPQRIRQLREMIDRLNPKCELEVDGGITLETTPPSVEAGATVLVAASAIFGAEEGPTEIVKRMLAIARK